MGNNQKLTGEKRRGTILQWLKDAKNPITGGELAEKTNVSRQVIVQDISLLKAKNEPIMATSQGYLYIRETPEEFLHKRVIACTHRPDQTKEELYLLVDHGVTVKDVRIEHPVYGDLTASIMVSSRHEVDQFLDKIHSTNAAYLSQLTDGTHLHTLEADTEEKLDAACTALEKADILIHT
ncbi:HTH domain-containing protein [Sediminibacillus dalangtanensis]|uniref:HTH domain-containing protein n=1 Tax=Sediminibacillus dalangtanensis TaxID=2729421 RepID=A0ABX7VWB8_9BACI|nr:transcription repressor NadR [Sediminibacillus dalangtanensis]QTN01258.1 HTH domain-containing protein [Sediminibacillus dalangtanensis]